MFRRNKGQENSENNQEEIERRAEVQEIKDRVFDSLDSLPPVNEEALVYLEDLFFLKSEKDPDMPLKDRELWEFVGEAVDHLVERNPSLANYIDQNMGEDSSRLRDYYDQRGQALVLLAAIGASLKPKDEQ